MGIRAGYLGLCLVGITLLSLLALSQPRVEVSLQADAGAVTHTYRWESTHVMFSGKLRYAYEELNDTRSVGLMIDGTALGKVGMNSWYKSVGLRMGKVTGHVEVLAEDINGTLVLNVHGKGYSVMYSSIGMLYYLNESGTFNRYEGYWEWIGRFSINATISVEEPIIVGRAVDVGCPPSPI